MATPQATKASERELLLMPPTLTLTIECRGHLLAPAGASSSQGGGNVQRVGSDAAPGDLDDVPGQVPQPQRVSGDRHDLPRLPPTRPHHRRARRR